ncbi:MAG: DUF4919 domain-containing protein [Bacteroidales bacterium]|nr:DUF4919 domain-containing protein [Bacteroidales bacterium]
MNKFLIIFATMLFAFVAKGQDVDSVNYPEYVIPDYEQISKDCGGKAGVNYYNKLAKRFAEYDTTLTLRELQAFYYGQAYLDSYDPYVEYEELGEILSILRQETTLSDLKKVIKLADAIILKNPAEPRAYYYKALAQYIANEDYGEAEMHDARDKFNVLVDVLYSTGNGVSVEKAMHVVNVGHEYLILGLNDFNMNMQSLANIDGHSYDVFDLDSNEYNIDKLYFNVDLILGSWGKMFSEDLNPITTIDLELGVKFVLELRNTKSKNSEFVLVSKEKVEGPLFAEKDSLFCEPVAKNQIVGYFCPMYLRRESENIYNCLVFISSNENGRLYYDTYISRTGRKKDFSVTSNVGMFPGAMMNEMWHDEAQYLRISNIRTKE